MTPLAAVLISDINLRGPLPPAEMLREGVAQKLEIPELRVQDLALGKDAFCALRAEERLYVLRGLKLNPAYQPRFVGQVPAGFVYVLVPQAPVAP